jgi:hypothetical protein
MNIVSNTSLIMVGSTASGVPLPSFLPDLNQQAAFVAVYNVGPCDCHVAVGSSAGVAADSSSQLIAAGNYAAPPGTLRDLTSIAIGPFVVLSLTPGDLFFSAVAIPIQIAQAYTNGTAASDSVSVAVDSATGIAVGQCVTDNAGAIPAGTTVTAIDGTSVTLSQATTAELSETPLTFSAAPSPQPPGILAVALGI